MACSETENVSLILSSDIEYTANMNGSTHFATTLLRLHVFSSLSEGEEPTENTTKPEKSQEQTMTDRADYTVYAHGGDLLCVHVRSTWQTAAVCLAVVSY